MPTGKASFSEASLRILLVLVSYEVEKNQIMENMPKFSFDLILCVFSKVNLNKCLVK